MSRFHVFIRYLAVFLAAVYALADGHLLCAPCLAFPSTRHMKHDCEHSHCPAPELLASACCSDNHDGGKFPCNGNDLPAIIVPCYAYEWVMLLDIVLAGSVFVVPAEYPPIQAETLVSHSPAPSLRLHLLYEVLVI